MFSPGSQAPTEGVKCWPFTSVSVPADLAHLPDNVLVCYELVAIACWNGILAKAPLFVPRDGTVGHVHLFCFVWFFLSAFFSYSFIWHHSEFQTAAWRRGQTQVSNFKMEERERERESEREGEREIEREGRLPCLLFLLCLVMLLFKYLRRLKHLYAPQA